MHIFCYVNTLGNRTGFTWCGFIYGSKCRQLSRFLSSDLLATRDHWHARGINTVYGAFWNYLNAKIIFFAKIKWSRYCIACIILYWHLIAKTIDRLMAWRCWLYRTRSARGLLALRCSKTVFKWIRERV